ncbi:MarR family transcriptional regulator [Ramlibacter albus]|uniref:MarR family transcriptional regulator n=1 Tax=Ramlibacter albus TaxID=2079448 RepID=A0A923M4Z6_9BURK|nr:MarR family transcriptional regulator [Ramlibacter albus]MBC5763018.1 MarR family transcriptional regulator [Ramlibacter albus]
MESRSRAHEQFGNSLGRVSRLWRAEIDRRLAEHGSTDAQWLALLRLQTMDQPVTQAALAAAIGVQNPSMVRMLDRLEAEGLIERTAVPGDRRAKAVRLTAKARPRLARIRTVTDSLRTELFRGIDARELDACMRVFSLLESKLRGFGAFGEADAAPSSRMIVP